MKCLILGASGQVGGLLAAAASDRDFAQFGTTFRARRPDLFPLDVSDAAAVERLVRAYRPDVVFLPAGFTNVDLAETWPDECAAVNRGGAVNAARAVRDCGGTLVLFSTDHVFGDSDCARGEDDAVEPRTAYARSKAEAEACVRELLPDRHLILRASWVFGPDRQAKNFVYRALRTLDAGQRLTIANDQYGQPTYGPDLAEAAFELVEQGQRGTFHVVGPDRLTRFAFARLVAHVFRRDADLVRGVSTEQLNQPAPRPKHVWLARHKLREALGRQPVRSAAEALRDLRARLGRSAPLLSGAA